MYFDLHLADIPVWIGVGSFERAMNKEMNLFLSEHELEDKQLAQSVRRDIKHCFYKYKTSPQEYFLFSFRDKSEDERATYLPDSIIMKSVANKTGRRIHDEELNDKYHFYELNKPFFKRKAMLLNEQTAREVFVRFALSLGKVIAKPNKAALGKGVEIFRIRNVDEAHGAFEMLQVNNIEYVVEALIEQNKEMAVWNPTSVNTIRVTSFLTHGQFSVLCPFMRTGRKGSIVDNGGQGGIFASIDKETGSVCTEGMDERGNTYKKHPDSGLTYKGWVVPRWDELMKLTETVHRNMAKHVYVGWDFALTDQGWVLIEGNWGEFVCQQMTNKKGYKQEFLTLLNA